MIFIQLYDKNSFSSCLQHFPLCAILWLNPFFSMDFAIRKSLPEWEARNVLRSFFKSDRMTASLTRFQSIRTLQKDYALPIRIIRSALCGECGALCKRERPSGKRSRKAHFFFLDYILGRLTATIEIGMSFSREKFAIIGFSCKRRALPSRHPPSLF